MKFHREGHGIIGATFLTSSLILVMITLLFPENRWLIVGTAIFVLGFSFLIAQFFRYPTRSTPTIEDDVISPADGKIVVIEEVEETEYFKDRRIQISIFMSPTNVHVNWIPYSGVINYMQYHPGKYLVAWHPKSSTLNEHSTTVVAGEEHQILFRQIAGAMARRIVYYPTTGTEVKAGDEFGFIKFGSRLDVLLPLEASIKVKLGDKVTGAETILASL